MLSHGSRRSRGRGAATAAGPASVTKSSGLLALLNLLTARKASTWPLPGAGAATPPITDSSTQAVRGACQPSRSMPDNRGNANVLPEPAVGGYVTPGTRQARLSPLGNRSGKLHGSCTREDRLDRTRPSPGPAAAGF